MIIELVGIRGAGKTSAVAEVVKALAEAGVEARPVHAMNVRRSDGTSAHGGTFTLAAPRPPCRTQGSRRNA